MTGIVVSLILSQSRVVQQANNVKDRGKSYLVASLNSCLLIMRQALWHYGGIQIFSGHNRPSNSSYNTFVFKG